ncbi:hypothetical protein A2160_04330 [Candidatus Beckwithbacteria bacterium RBG_13_42_9]|uniref:Uncharacterized protein n=1 Tax=Candidatus Beckwithbacteria bacterium RBG_13_42_9 TaxID=1797457 RepID=A0A1F5E6F9_9BACT|nr:MAG: hypothetical protein A2160_04330 [Candidatus Beckwithbacteria bacterium RBG_13_42_9]
MAAIELTGIFNPLKGGESPLLFMAHQLYCQMSGFVYPESCVAAALVVNTEVINPQALSNYMLETEERSRTAGFKCSGTDLPLVIHLETDSVATARNAAHGIEHNVLVLAVATLSKSIPELTLAGGTYMAEDQPGTTLSLLSIVEVKPTGNFVRQESVNTLVENLFGAVIMDCNQRLSINQG